MSGKTPGVSAIEPSTATLPTYRAGSRDCGSVLRFLLSLYLIALVVIELSVIARTALGAPAHTVLPFFGAQKRSAAFVALLQAFAGMLMVVRVNVLFSPESVGAWRVCSWVHVLEAV